LVFDPEEAVAEDDGSAVADIFEVVDDMLKQAYEPDSYNGSGWEARTRE
jgi:hypothetical protein